MIIKKRRRRRFNPRKFFKRLLVLVIIVGVSAGSFLLGRSAFRFLAGILGKPKLLATVVAEAVTDVSGIEADAILLRDEIVVLAEKAGSLNLLVDAGAEVQAGMPILEIVDKALLAETDQELMRLQEAADGPQNTSDLDKLAESLAKDKEQFGQTMADYRQAVGSRAIESYQGLYQDLVASAKKIAQNQSDWGSLSQAENDWAEERLQLEEKRRQAILPVPAPLEGRVHFWVDGLEDIARVDRLGANTWQKLSDAKKNPIFEIVADGEAEPGHPLCKIGVGDHSYLLLTLKADTRIPSDWEMLKVYSESGGLENGLAALILEHEHLEPGQLLLQIEGQIPLPRFSQVSLQQEDAFFSSVPKTAIVKDGEDSRVLIVEGTVARARSIEIHQEAGKAAIVIGLEPGDVVIAKPAGIVDGMDVADRLRK